MMAINVNRGLHVAGILYKIHIIHVILAVINTLSKSIILCQAHILRKHVHMKYPVAELNLGQLKGFIIFVQYVVQNILMVRNQRMVTVQNV